MKSSRFILASLLALGSAGMASAQTVIHITGSTSFRAAAYAAIEGILESGFTGAYTGTGSIGSANQAIFKGTATNGTSVVIKTSFSGGIGGIIVLTQNLPVPDSAIGVSGGWLSNAELPASGVTDGANASDIDTATTADATFSETFQTSTTFTSPALTGANGYANGIVAVSPYEWVLGNYAPGTPPAAFTNVTSELAVAALNSVAALSQVTGNTADETTNIQVVGRDSDSGTRFETFAETGFGAFTAPTQYEPIPVGGTTITELLPWQAQKTDGISFPAGTQGFSSGSGVAGALNASGSLTASNPDGTYSATGSVLIGYLGVADAESASQKTATNPNGTGNGTALAFNGVTYSAAAVEQGLYPLWAYEHVYYRSAYTGTAGGDVVDLIAAQIHNIAADTTDSGILISSMEVSRPNEGGPITPIF